jgi:hypothetical protein
VAEPAPASIEEVAPESVSAPEIPPVAAQEALPATIAAEPVAEALPAQPGPTEPPAPVVEPVPTLTGTIGATVSARTPTGAVIQLRNRWINQSQIIGSHLPGFRENPAYPQELQPRDRSRPGLQDQVNNIANHLNPDEVADNPLVEHGGPVVDGRGIVEVGKGRDYAIKIARPDIRAAYHKYFVDNAARLGLDSTEVVADPLGEFVRERLTPVEDRVRFAEEMDSSRTARMGPLDQAKVDARRLPDALLAELKEGAEGKTAGEILNGQKEWLAQALQEVVPRSEWDSVIDQSGKIAPAAVQRIRNAIFQKAYDPQGPLTSLLVETTDSGIKNILTGLLNSASMVARADTRVRMGEVEGNLIGRDLATAAEKFATLRADPNVVLKKANAPANQPGYTSYTDYYQAQQEMFGGLTPRQVELMRGIEERAGSAPKIKAFVSLIAEPILRAPHKDQGILFMKVPDEILYQGGNRVLAEKARQHLGRSAGPEDTLFIMQDGTELGGRSGDAIHGVSANEIVNGVSRSDDIALRTLLMGGKFIRANGPSNYEFIDDPTLDQIKVMVRNSRSVDPQRTLILEAQDPRPDHLIEVFRISLKEWQSFT